MPELIPLNLGAEGIRYVRSRLSDGGALLRAIAESFGSGGDAFTPVPTGTNLARAREFDVGGLLSRRQAKRWLANHVISLSADGEAYQLVLADVWAKPTDEAVRQARQRKFFHASSVYYLLEGDEIGVWAIGAAIDIVTSFHLIGGIVRPAMPLGPVPAEELRDDSVIKTLARNTQEVFVSAYDQEGFVFWRRSSAGQS